MIEQFKIQPRCGPDSTGNELNPLKHFEGLLKPLLLSIRGNRWFIYKKIFLLNTVQVFKPTVVPRRNMVCESHPR